MDVIRRTHLTSTGMHSDILAMIDTWTDRQINKVNATHQKLATKNREKQKNDHM